MKKIALLLALALSASGCWVSEDTAREVLEDEGYRDVEVTGPAFFSCSDDDSFASSWRARRTVVRPDGSTSERVVEGVICCGWLKDCTVRH